MASNGGGTGKVLPPDNELRSASLNVSTMREFVGCVYSRCCYSLSGHAEHAGIIVQIGRSVSHSAGKFLITLALAVSVRTALADEASDAVQVLTRLWRGHDDSGWVTQFIGDSRTFKMRRVGQLTDGTVAIVTTEAPFKFLQISEPDVRYDVCLRAQRCLVVTCLFKRPCISSTVVTSYGRKLVTA
jgi:hypothetical protein